MNRNNELNNKRGSIGITIVMLVFCLLMSVSMSYQKTIQTETMVQNNINYSDRAVDAAFSGINYAMAAIQSNKKVFASTNAVNVKFTPSANSDDNYKSQWINLATTATFSSYLDDDRATGQKQHPPYRFKIACNENSYFSKDSKNYVLIKSFGEYIKYDENNDIVSSYSAQLMAECIIATQTKTIRLNRYRRMQLQDPNSDSSDFYSFATPSGDSSIDRYLQDK